MPLNDITALQFWELYHITQKTTQPPYIITVNPSSLLLLR